MPDKQNTNWLECNNSGIFFNKRANLEWLESELRRVMVSDGLSLEAAAAAIALRLYDEEEEAAGKWLDANERHELLEVARAEGLLADLLAGEKTLTRRLAPIRRPRRRQTVRKKPPAEAPTQDEVSRAFHEFSRRKRQ